MEQFNVIMKGKMCQFKIEDKVIFMMAENTGGHLIRLGKPLEIKKEALMSRNKMPKMFMDFIAAWKKEDIERVSKMETDKEMIDDMKNDFKLMGYEIIKEDGV